MHLQQWLANGLQYGLLLLDLGLLGMNGLQGIALIREQLLHTFPPLFEHAENSDFSCGSPAPPTLCARLRNSFRQPRLLRRADNTGILRRRDIKAA